MLAQISLLIKHMLSFYALRSSVSKPKSVTHLKSKYFAPPERPGVHFEHEVDHALRGRRLLL